MNGKINVQGVHKWICVHAEKGVNGKKAGTSEFAAYLGIENDDSAIAEVLKFIYSKDSERRKNVLQVLRKNEKDNQRKRTASSANQANKANRNAKQKVRRNYQPSKPETTESMQDSRSEQESDSVDEELQKLKDVLESYKSGVKACNRVDLMLQEDMKEIKKKAENLQKKAESLMRQKKAVLRKAEENAAQKEYNVRMVDELTNKIAELEIEQNALHMTLFKECVSDTVSLVSALELPKEEIDKKAYELMTSQDFSKDFLECRNDCINWNETRMLAKMLLIAEMNERKIYWYFPKGCLLSDLMTYLGGNCR